MAKDDQDVDHEKLATTFDDILKLLSPLSPEERRRAIHAAMIFYEVPCPHGNDCYR